MMGDHHSQWSHSMMGDRFYIFVCVFYGFRGESSLPASPLRSLTHSDDDDDGLAHDRNTHKSTTALCKISHCCCAHGKHALFLTNFPESVDKTGVVGGSTAQRRRPLTTRRRRQHTQNAAPLYKSRTRAFSQRWDGNFGDIGVVGVVSDEFVWSLNDTGEQRRDWSHPQTRIVPLSLFLARRACVATEKWCACVICDIITVVKWTSVTSKRTRSCLAAPRFRVNNHFFRHCTGQSRHVGAEQWKERAHSF